MKSKGVYITDENRDELAAMLDRGEGKAHARCISVDDLLAFVDRLDTDVLPLSIMAKQEKRGALVGWMPAHPLPNSYQWRADATRVDVEHGPRGWRLTDVSRGRANTNAHDGIYVVLPRNGADSARARFEATFRELDI